jgi:hypothetical protein
VVSHIVHAAENSVTPVPVAQDARVVFRLMSGKVLLAGESSPLGLRAVSVPAEEGFGVSLVVLSEVAPPGEDGS